MKLLYKKTDRISNKWTTLTNITVEWLKSITGIWTAIVVEFISTGPATFPFSNIEESLLTIIVVESILIGGWSSFPFMDDNVDESVLTALSVESILKGGCHTSDGCELSWLKTALGFWAALKGGSHTSDGCELSRLKTALGFWAALKTGFWAALEKCGCSPNKGGRKCGVKRGSPTNSGTKCGVEKCGCSPNKGGGKCGVPRICVVEKGCPPNRGGNFNGTLLGFWPGLKLLDFIASEEWKQKLLIKRKRTLKILQNDIKVQKLSDKPNEPEHTGPRKKSSCLSFSECRIMNLIMQANTLFIRHYYKSWADIIINHVYKV